MIQVENINKYYTQGSQKIHVLKDLNLNIEKGEKVAILGTSGSGKTTLLSLLAGLDRADQGQITIAGKKITHMNEADLTSFRARELGIIFQKFHLFAHLNAIENVSLSLEIQNDDDAIEKAKKLLKKVKLDHRFEHYPSQLSGGECQRVGFARALVTSPQVVFADEPSGSLDEHTGKEVMDLLFELVAEQNKTLILVTHDRNLATRCNKIYELVDGKLKTNDL